MYNFDTRVSQFYHIFANQGGVWQETTLVVIHCILSILSFHACFINISRTIILNTMPPSIFCHSNSLWPVYYYSITM